MPFPKNEGTKNRVEMSKPQRIRTNLRQLDIIPTQPDDFCPPVVLTGGEEEDLFEDLSDDIVEQLAPFLDLRDWERAEQVRGEEVLAPNEFFEELIVDNLDAFDPPLAQDPVVALQQELERFKLQNAKLEQEKKELEVAALTVKGEVTIVRQKLADEASTARMLRQQVQNMEKIQAEETSLLKQKHASELESTKAEMRFKDLELMKASFKPVPTTPVTQKPTPKRSTHVLFGPGPQDFERPQSVESATQPVIQPPIQPVIQPAIQPARVATLKPYATTRAQHHKRRALGKTILMDTYYQSCFTKTTYTNSSLLTSLTPGALRQFETDRQTFLSVLNGLVVDWDAHVGKFLTAWDGFVDASMRTHQLLPLEFALKMLDLGLQCDETLVNVILSQPLFTGEVKDVDIARESTSDVVLLPRTFNHIVSILHNLSQSVRSQFGKYLKWLDAPPDLDATIPLGNYLFSILRAMCCSEVNRDGVSKFVVVFEGRVGEYMADVRRPWITNLQFLEWMKVLLQHPDIASFVLKTHFPTTVTNQGSGGSMIERISTLYTGHKWDSLKNPTRTIPVPGIAPIHEPHQTPRQALDFLNVEVAVTQLIYQILCLPNGLVHLRLANNVWNRLILALHTEFLAYISNEEYKQERLQVIIEGIGCIHAVLLREPPTEAMNIMSASHHALLVDVVVRIAYSASFTDQVNLSRFGTFPSITVFQAEDVAFHLLDSLEPFSGLID
jgi:hypothetical protein